MSRQRRRPQANRRIVAHAEKRMVYAHSYVLIVTAPELRA